MNLIFMCLWDFILSVQYKSQQNKLKVLSYTDFVFNAYIIIYAGSVFFGHPVDTPIIIHVHVGFSKSKSGKSVCEN